MTIVFGSFYVFCNFLQFYSQKLSSVCVCVHVYMCVRVHVCVHACVNMCLHIHVQVFLERFCY